MSDRLAEIEATRKKILSEYEFSRADDDMLMLLTSGIPWLLARIRELEAQAARGAKVIDAASRLIDEGAPVVAHEYAGLECFYCGAYRSSCEWMALRAALAAREE